MDRKAAEAIYHAGLETTVAVLLEKDETIEKLKAQLTARSKNSTNSSKPPSTDLFRKPRSLRAKSGKRSGGQPGHGGHSLSMVDKPDHLVTHTLKGLCPCGKDLSKGEALPYERRQVHDMAAPRPLEVTEHRAEVKRCACGRIHMATFPPEVSAPVQYGSRIRARTLYLNKYQLIPMKRTVEAMWDLFDVRMSQGTVHNIAMMAYARLAETAAAIKAAIAVAPVVHFDETGTYVAGKRWWEHVSSTPKFTFFFCHPNRGKKALEDGGIIAGFAGRAVHDAYQSYFDYDIMHALCNAHHLRDLLFVHTECKQRWAKTMIGLLCGIKRTVDRAKAAGRQSLAPATLKKYRSRYERIIACGYRVNPLAAPPVGKKKRGRRKQSPGRNLLDRLSKHIDEALAFMYDFNVPFDNNLAERDVRMEKTRQKISGCFRSIAGANATCRIRGFISTVRKHGLNLFTQLVNCFEPSYIFPFKVP